MSWILPLCVAGLPAGLTAVSVRAPSQEPETDRRRTPVVEVIERVKPAVVSITTNVARQAADFFGRTFKLDTPGPSGTGVVVFEDGFIITNYHVIGGATEIQVRFDVADDDRVYDAQLVSMKPEEDLALLKIESDLPFAKVTMCESDPILGEQVIAIGNAFGHSHTVSTGIVSGLHRDIHTREGLHFDNLIQTDASINPGNSGGPLLNLNGELIGINSAMQGTAENIGFAIPVNHVRKVLQEELLALSKARAWLGFDLDENTLVVQSIVADGPAALAGMQVGDRLQALSGHLLASLEGEVRDVYRRVRLSVQPKTVVPVVVQRGRSRVELELVAWNKADGILFERLGLIVETKRLGKRGGNPFLVVKLVQPGGPAAEAGLEPGDVLTTLKREGRRATWFQQPEDLAGAVARLDSGTELSIEVWRDLDGDGLYFEHDVYTDYSEGLTGPIVVR